MPQCETGFGGAVCRNDATWRRYRPVEQDWVNCCAGCQNAYRCYQPESHFEPLVIDECAERALQALIVRE